METKQKIIEQKRKELIENFESMKDKADLQALSKLSLEQPLTDGQHQKFMALALKVGLIKIYDKGK